MKINIESRSSFYKVLSVTKKAIPTICVGICVILACLSIIFFAFGGASFIERNNQSSIAIITLEKDGETLPSASYTLNAKLNDKTVNIIDGENGYSFKTDYGEIRGTIQTADGFTFEYGFVNSNNWHNIQIHLIIETSEDNVFIKQLITYKTDNDIICVHESESHNAITDKDISVFIGGIN